ncbi:FAD-dependent oxidoreductase [Bradyrhizobium zhanjiangense]|uniref:FAD-binding oxidoreductase n=1 Tax=Bradyrhizobium zhanjiangense TaxID=1325107 RepID=A0ABY0D8H7_9BRAD|nr:FAD-dependent oxidoreductase [Bradyrhizobium zhanjiangense]RXG84750.1 FAD-binding oxidoreductase [Bradyrhizobium zhanjiangense]
MADKIDAPVVVGVTAALALQRRLKVMLLDQRFAAGLSSFGNAGMIAPGAFTLSAHYRIADLPATFFKPSATAALDWTSAARLLPSGIQYAKATDRTDSDMTPGCLTNCAATRFALPTFPVSRLAFRNASARRESV